MNTNALPQHSSSSYLFKSILVFFSICTLLSLASCKKENPFLDQEKAKYLVKRENTEIKNFFFGNGRRAELFSVDDFRSEKVELSAFDHTNGGPIDVSPDGNKVVFQQNYYTLRWFDLEGNVFSFGPIGYYVKNLEWIRNDVFAFTNNSKNGLRFYDISKNEEIYWSVGVPIISLTDNPLSSKDYLIQSFSYSKDGDLAYVINYYNDKSYVVLKPNDGTGRAIIYDDELDNPVYVRFSGNDKDLTIGYGALDGKIEVIKMFNNLDLKPVFQLSTNEYNEYFYSPIYRSDLNFMLMGYYSSKQNQSGLVKYDLERDQMRLYGERFMEVTFVDWIQDQE